MATIIVTTDEANNDGFVDVSGDTPNEEVYVHVSSVATPPNQSTENITGGLHNTANSDGNVRFHLPYDYLVPEPDRDITATIVPVDFARVHIAAE